MFLSTFTKLSFKSLTLRTYESQAIHMKKVLSILLLLGFALASPCNTLLPDSVLTKLSQAKGESRLKLLYELYHQHSGSPAAGNCLELLLKESIRQKNKEMEMKALGMQIQLFVNTNQGDSVIRRAPEIIELARRNKIYKSMFSIQDLLVGQLMISKRFAEALRLTHEQLKEAKQLNNPLGVAIANKNLGMIYRFTGRSAEAWKFYMESLEWLKKANEKSLIIDLYLDLISVNRECTQLEQALENSNKCLALIEENMQDNNKYSDKSKLTAQYFTCMCFKAIVYLNLKKTEDARKCIATAQKLVNPSWSGIWLYPLWEAQIEYNINTKNYSEALKFNELYNSYVDPNQLSMHLFLANKKGIILEGLNQYKQASESYRKAIRIKDTLFNINFAKQLEEIRSLYEVDKLEMKAEKDRQYFIFLFVGIITLFVICILMGIIIFIVRRNSKRLEEKNRKLFLQLKEKDALQAEIARLNNSFPREESNTMLPLENILFSKLQKWLETEKRFTSLKLTAEEASAALGTNTRYLYDAIRRSAGQTFNDYINTLKLEYARKLLLSKKNNQMTIEGISNEAGFNTRSNFYRLFRLKYGLTPSELRKQDEDIPG